MFWSQVRRLCGNSVGRQNQEDLLFLVECSTTLLNYSFLGHHKALDYAEITRKTQSTFIHISKTGGSFIEEALCGWEKQVRISIQTWWRYLRDYILESTTHCSTWHAVPLEYIPNSITIVREPWDRERILLHRYNSPPDKPYLQYPYKTCVHAFLPPLAPFPPLRLLCSLFLLLFFLYLSFLSPFLSYLCLSLRLLFLFHTITKIKALEKIFIYAISVQN